jgi:aubergine-like protein
LLEIPARVLDPTTVVFGKNYEVKVNPQTSSWDIKSQQLFAPVSFNTNEWLVISPLGFDNDRENFLKIFFDVSHPLGITLGQPKKVAATGKTPVQFLQTLEAALTPQIKLVLAILPNNGKKLYDDIKKLLCLKKPVISQCIVLRNIQNPKGIHSKATKLAVQIVSKYGGAPWIIKNIKFPAPTMVCGLDVYHSGEKGVKTKSSIVGFTASLDLNVTKFYSSLVVQKPGQEIVEAMESCLLAALHRFKQVNNEFPQHIILYRDGVGEGQVQYAVDQEVKAARKCFASLNISTKLTYIVVLKRINTRLFTKSGPTLNNPIPGTVVDSVITEPDAQEFFLISQHVNQGSATPTHYQVVENDPKFNSDYLQDLTFKLCHCYFNWFGTVRVPAPCMYAHKIAFLAGQSLEGKEDPQKRLSDCLYYL